MKNYGVHGTSAKATYYTLVSTNTRTLTAGGPEERTELVQPDRRPPQTANGKGQTSTVDGIHQTPYLSSFERTIGATLIIPARRSFSRFVCAASLPLSPLQVLFGPL
jgi:hypothetical protein